MNLKIKGKNKQNQTSHIQHLTSDHRGITLIALVITIIVMLILVSVTINLAINGGLFGYAGKAARETEEAKQKELDWLNVEGLSTDQLIAKFTTDRKKDLEVLNKYYTFMLRMGNNEEFTEAEMKEIVELQNILTRDMENGELYGIGPFSTESSQIIYYHGYYYKIEEEYDNEERLTEFSIEPYELTEIDNLILALDREEVNTIEINEEYFVFYNNKLYKEISENENCFVEASAEEYAEYEQYLQNNFNSFIIQNGRFIVGNLCKYNNNYYKIDNNDEVVLIGAKTEIAIVYDRETENYIAIRPTANQTWLDWANTTGGDDLTIIDIHGTPTLLKQLLKTNPKNFRFLNETNNTLITDFSNTIITVGCIYDATQGK